MKTKIKLFCHLHTISFKSRINFHSKVEECFTEISITSEISITFFLDGRADRIYRIRNSKKLWVYE